MARNILLKIAADVDPARRGLRGIKGDLKGLGETRAEPLVRLREQGLEQKLTRLQERLTALSRQESTPKIKIAMGQVAGQIQHVERELGQMGVAGARAGREASAGLSRAGHASDGLSSKLKHHRSEFIGFAKGAVGITAAFSAITDAKAAVETTDNLAKATLILGRNFGFTAEEASKWAVVAQSRDVDPTALSTGFTRLSRAVEQARAGSKGYQDTFKQLGISNADLIRGQRDFPFLISKVTDAFSHMSGGTRRAAIAQQIFGRGSRSLLLLLRQGSQGFDAQSKMAAKYGATLNEKTLGGVEKLVVAQRQAHYATTGLQIAFGTGLAPILTRVTQRVSHFILQMRNGRGEGGRFARSVKSVVSSLHPLISALGTVITFLTRHPRALIVAVHAWLAYRLAVAAAGRVTKIQTAAMVLGIRRVGPAVATTAAEIEGIGAASTAASAEVTAAAATSRGAFMSMLGPIGLVIAAIQTLHDLHPGGDIQGFIDKARAKVDAAAAKADRAAADPRLSGFPDGGASTANGRPVRSGAGGGKSQGTIRSAADIIAGLGSPRQIESRNLNLDLTKAKHAYVTAVRKFGADSAAAIQAAAGVSSARTALHEFEHPPRTGDARRRRRRRRAGATAPAGSGPASGADLGTLASSQAYERAVRKYGIDSPQAKIAKDRENVSSVRSAIQNARDRLAADVRKFGATSERAIRDRTTLSRLGVRLIQANHVLADALHKNTEQQRKALLPRLTDVAYHPITGHMHHGPIQNGVGGIKAPAVHHWGGVHITTPGGQAPDARYLSTQLDQMLGAKGNGN